MTMNNPIPIKELIGDAKTIGIAGHIRPDGRLHRFMHDTL